MSNNRVPTFIAPGVSTVIVQKPVAQARIRGTTRIAVPYRSKAGRDNVWVRYEDYDQWYNEQGGSLNYNLYGQDQYTADVVSKNGGILVGMRVMPEDAKYSHFILGVLTKRVNPIDHPTLPGTPIRATVVADKDPENIESGDPKRGDEYVKTLTNGYVLTRQKTFNTTNGTKISAIENFFETGNGTELQDGYTLNKILMVTPRGRGKDYDNIGIQLNIQTDLDLNYSFRVYSLQFVRLTDEGGVVDIEGEGPWSVSFDPEAKNQNGRSFYIEDVVFERSRQFNVKVNQDAYQSVVNDFNAYKTTPVAKYEYDIITGKDRPITPGTQPLKVNHNDIVMMDEIKEGIIAKSSPITLELKSYQTALDDLISDTSTVDGTAGVRDYERKSVLGINTVFRTANDDISTLVNGRIATSTLTETQPSQQELDTSAFKGKRADFSAGCIADKLYGLSASSTDAVTPIVSDGSSIYLLDVEDNDVDLALTAPTVSDVITNRGYITSWEASTIVAETDPDPGYVAADVEIVEGGSNNIFTFEDSGAAPGTALDPGILGVEVDDALIFPASTGYLVGKVTAISASPNYEITLEIEDSITYDSGWRANDFKIVKDIDASLSNFSNLAPAFQRRDTLFATDNFTEDLASGLPISTTAAPYSEGVSLYETARCFYAKDNTQWGEDGSAFSPESYIFSQRVINSVNRLLGADIKGSIASTSPIHTRSSSMPDFKLNGWVKLNELEGNNVIDWFIDNGDVDEYFFTANIPTASRITTLKDSVGANASLEDLIYFTGAAGLDEGRTQTCLENLKLARNLISSYNRSVQDFIEIMTDVPETALKGEGGFGTERDVMTNYHTILDGYDLSTEDSNTVLQTVNGAMIYLESVVSRIDSVRELSSNNSVSETQATTYFGNSARIGSIDSSTKYQEFVSQIALIRRRLTHSYSVETIVETTKKALDQYGFSSTGVFDIVILELGESLHERQKLVVEKLVGATGYIRTIFETLAELKDEFVVYSSGSDPFADSPIDNDTLNSYITVIENKIDNIVNDGSVLATSDPGTSSIVWDLPVYFKNGSEGSFDVEKYTGVQRAATFKALLAQAWNGTIVNPRTVQTDDEYLPSSIRNKKELIVNILMDANFPTNIKKIMADLAEFRLDCMAFLDVGPLTTLNAVRNYRRRELPVTHWSSAIFMHTGEVVDPQTGNSIRVTGVYDMARRIPLQDIQKGIGAALAGVENGQANMTRINPIPESQSERDSLYALQVNHVSPNSNPTGVTGNIGWRWRSQLTAQQIYGALTDIPNVRVVQEMVRVCEAITENYEFIRFADEGAGLYQSLNNELNQYLNQWVGTVCSRANAVALGTPADRLQKLTRITIDVDFYEFSERFLQTFKAGLQSQETA